MNIVNLGLLCSVSVPVTIILSIIMLAIGGGAGIGVYAVVVNKKSKLAKAKADKILEDAHAQAEKIKNEQVEQTNKEINLLKSTFEQENKERREEAKRSEERLYAREEMLSNAGFAAPHPRRVLPSTSPHMRAGRTAPRPYLSTLCERGYSLRG